MSLVNSIGLATTTVEYLIGALDELAAIDSELEITAFRVSPELVQRGATRSTVFGGIDALPRLLDPTSPSNLADALVAMVHRLPNSSKRIAAAMRAGLTRSFLLGVATRALAIASERDDVVLLGRLVETLYSDNDVLGSLGTSELADAGSQALRNFVREISREPMDFPFLIGLCDLVRSDPLGTSYSGLRGEGFRRAWSHQFAPQRPREQMAHLAALGLQFLELAEVSTRHWKRLSPQDQLVRQAAS